MIHYLNLLDDQLLLFPSVTFMQVEAICRQKLAAQLPVSSKEVALSAAKDINGLR